MGLFSVNYDVYEGGDSHYHTHNTTEKRAPTDESVALLREMEKASEDKVQKALRLDSNEFKGLVQHYFDASQHLEWFQVTFDLNGKRLVVKESKNSFETLEQFVVRLRDSVSQEIASAMLTCVFDEAFKGGKFRGIV